MSEEPMLRLEGIRRTFRQGGAELEVLKGADFALPAGRIVALVGPSGAGKSTLLHICGLLEPATGGEVLIDGRPTGRLSDAERTRMRRELIGFVYQFHHLLPDFTAEENVALPQLVAGQSRRTARARAAELLGRLGLTPRLTHRPGRLSGGEQQRVAIARALANAPRLILADEPTGNLDPATADRVFDELLAVVRDTHTAALIATHNPELASRMDEVWRLADGKLQRAAA
jgi:lipoprotein-releasing system ATP-binding protein